MKTEVNIRDAEEEKIDQAAALRSKELASMKALTFRHWEEITGVGICSENSYVVSQNGIYPEQYSDDDLRLLTPEERKILLEMADRDPLIFPCAPSQLLSFVNEDQAMCFEVPDAFREEVERLGAEQRASEEFGQICGPIDQSTGIAVKTRTRKDGLAIAMDAGFSSYKSKNSANPTARALFDWLPSNDETDNIVEFNANTDKLTWRRSDGGLSDTSFKAFQGRFTAFMKKQD